MPATAVGSANGMSMMRVEHAPAGKLVTHQRPDDQRAEHEIDRRPRRARAPKLSCQRVKHAAAGHDRQELAEAKLRGLEEQRRRAESARSAQSQSKRQAERDPEAGDHARRDAPAASVMVAAAHRGLGLTACRSRRTCRRRRSASSAPSRQPPNTSSMVKSSTFGKLLVVLRGDFGIARAVVVLRRDLLAFAACR